MGIIMRNSVPYAAGSDLPEGGTKGQALVKASNLDGDVEWADIGGGSDNTFVFDVDSDQFTEDPDNPDGKHYGMTIASPTYDELLAMLQTDTFVYARLLYNSGKAYEIMQLFHNNTSIYGTHLDVEFPKKRLMFASAYVSKRNNDTYFGTYQDYIGGSIDAYTKAETDALLDEKASLNIATIPGGGGGDEISATVSQGTDSVNVNYYKDSELPNSLNLNIGEDSFRVPTTDYVDGAVGDLTTLTTTDKSSAVAAINEIDFAVKGLGEPFRVKQWGSNTLNVEIPYCTEDIANGSIPKMVYSIDDVEGADYQIVGMLAYEVFDAASGGNRINCFPVCQFTGNGQKELSVRWACMGTTRKTAKRINAWVLLKHR